MARVSNTLIGRSSGSIGNATFSTWKGINVLKEKATSVANPSTPTQLMNRSAMRQAVAIGRVLYAMVFLGFKSLAVKKSSFNAFVGAMRKFAFDYSAPPVATLVPGAVLISKGSVSETAIVTCTASRGLNTVVVDFVAGITGPGQSGTDTVIAAAFNQSQDLWAPGSNNAIRNDGSVSFALPAGWIVGDSLLVYLGFYNPSTGNASDSDNIAISVVA